MIAYAINVRNRCLYNSVIDNFKWYCRKKVSRCKQKAVKCRFTASIRTGTFFYKSKLNLSAIIRFMCCWLDNLPLTLIKKNTRIANQTAVDFSNFCRELIFDHMVTKSVPLGGPGKSVEIDESKFGRRKYNRGHRVEGQWVFGGFERETGRIFMVPVDKRDRATLLPIIENCILTGTTIHSDCWKAYDCLSDVGYQHLKVNHSLEFVDSETGACTNHIEAS